MTSLEDKILGEKTHYYCSSSEDEAEPEPTAGQTRPEAHQWTGSSVNTGPKGVIKDWQKYKQFENEKREANERQKLDLIKKLSITCATDDHSDPNLEDVDDSDDQFLKEYMMKRMQEMMDQVNSSGKDRPHFGHLIHLSSSDQFLDAIDKEEKYITIICHIYTNEVEECQEMNGCLTCLAKHYPRVKFCAIEASTAGMSRHFSTNGVPALLVYKSSSLVANYVRLTDQFNKPFFAVDIEKFLLENGILKEDMSVNGRSLESERTGVGSIRESSLEERDSSDSND